MPNCQIEKEKTMNHLEEREAVKFIIDGRLFDTATASPLAVDRGVLTPGYKLHKWYSGESYAEAEQIRYEDTLYRTGKGALFLHCHATIKFPKGKPVVEDSAGALTPEESVMWISSSGAAVLDGTGLQLPDEA